MGLILSLETLMRVIGLAVVGSILYEIIRPKLPFEIAPKYPKLPIIGAREGEWFTKLRAYWRNSTDIRTATEEAYKYKNQACLMPILDLGNVVILPPTEIAWFHAQPEAELSAHIHQLNAFQLNYTLTDPRLVDETQPIHQVLINTTLTRETNRLLPALAEEIACSVEDAWGIDTENLREFCLMDDMPNAVAQVVNRAFVGAPLSRNKALVEHAVTFARGLGFTSVLLRCTPVSLRSLAGLILTLPQKIGTWRFFRELRPEVHRRLGKLSDSESGDQTKANDFLQWTIDAAVQSGDPYMLKPDTIMGRVLLLNFVSIHTSSFAISHVLLDLAANSPDYIEQLRLEIVEGLEKHNGEWSKRSLGEMPKLDSVFRESQRMNSIVTVASPKPVCNPNGIVTPSGLTLPYGAYLGILGYPILHDPELYPDPEEFKPFRFSDRRTEASQQGLTTESARQAWISVTKQYTAFGTGSHACPGRFFAANMLKVMLAYILLHYDLESLPERPRSSTFSVSLFPPLKAAIRFKRRKQPLYAWKNVKTET
ncbi:cytochrome P450 [Xylariaceae sp. FL1019]|nr:cytochrome P450 [Xylariaceae sp. FL1019]